MNDDRDRGASSGKNSPSRSQAPAAPPCAMVIFGASGDLTKRKLIPALHNLRRARLLTDDFAVVGVARQSLTDDEFRARVEEDLAACDEPMDQPCRDWLRSRVFYRAGSA